MTFRNTFMFYIVFVFLHITEYPTKRLKMAGNIFYSVLRAITCFVGDNIKYLPKGKNSIKMVFGRFLK